MDANAALGGKAGLSQEKIEAALGIADPGVLSERERIAVEYADRVSATPVDVTDEFFARLQALFSEREIVQLTAHIAHENYNAKSNRPAPGRQQLLRDSGPHTGTALLRGLLLTRNPLLGNPLRP